MAGVVLDTMRTVLFIQLLIRSCVLVSVISWYNIWMDHPDEIDFDISKHTANIDPMVIQMIKMQERIKIFTKLRNLIHEKEYEQDRVAADVLGWAYDKMGD